MVLRKLNKQHHTHRHTHSETEERMIGADHILNARFLFETKFHCKYTGQIFDFVK